MNVTKRTAPAVLAVWALAMLSGCELFYPSETIRYRMTVTVDTPDGPRTGSSVVESTIKAGTRFGDASGIQFRLRGEAVAVPLPNGRVLFALLRPEESGDAAFYHARLMERAACGEGQPTVQPNPALCGSAQWTTFRPWAREQELSAEIGASIYPMLVTFRDLADPTSVARVDPVNLAASFGVGYRLKRITVQMTGENMTTGIEKRLGWLGQHPEPSLNPDHGQRDFSLPATLHHGDFRQGEY
ncbi:hypothetical protein [Rhizorhapis suberifaciens]|uniref:Lipoprotein n=1 Tax=Rhizorhapis suberifaciens TaxID=13656 RepID=A0A840HSL4_9SPHN|nr:hypothetical protein [Rhizorhapis suberifaciens]MBB4640570.1 hypothetical protein [Rhizorhapis suberifaciens]